MSILEVSCSGLLLIKCCCLQTFDMSLQGEYGCMFRGPLYLRVDQQWLRFLCFLSRVTWFEVRWFELFSPLGGHLILHTLWQASLGLLGGEFWVCHWLLELRPTAFGGIGFEYWGRFRVAVFGFELQCSVSSCSAWFWAACNRSFKVVNSSLLNLCSSKFSQRCAICSLRLEQSINCLFSKSPEVGSGRAHHSLDSWFSCGGCNSVICVVQRLKVRLDELLYA